MATLLGKRPVFRELKDWRVRGLFGMGGCGGRNLIVGLEPGNIISFREKGLRKRYDIALEMVFNLAVRHTMAKEDEAKRKAKKAARELKRRGLA